MQGNPDVHVILRGGAKGPNYEAEYARDCAEKLKKAGLSAKIMVRPVLPIYRLFSVSLTSHPTD